MGAMGIDQDDLLENWAVCPSFLLLLFSPLLGVQALARYAFWSLAYDIGVGRHQHVRHQRSTCALWGQTRCFCQRIYEAFGKASGAMAMTIMKGNKTGLGPLVHEAYDRASESCKNEEIRHAPAVCMFEDGFERCDL